MATQNRWRWRGPTRCRRRSWTVSIQAAPCPFPGVRICIHPGPHDAGEHQSGDLRVDRLADAWQHRRCSAHSHVGAHQGNVATPCARMICAGQSITEITTLGLPASCGPGCHADPHARERATRSLNRNRSNCAPAAGRSLHLQRVLRGHHKKMVLPTGGTYGYRDLLFLHRLQHADCSWAWLDYFHQQVID